LKYRGLRRDKLYRTKPPLGKRAGGETVFPQMVGGLSTSCAVCSEENIKNKYSFNHEEAIGHPWPKLDGMENRNGRLQRKKGSGQKYLCWCKNIL